MQSITVNGSTVKRLLYKLACALDFIVVFAEIDPKSIFIVSFIFHMRLEKTHIS